MLNQINNPFAIYLLLGILSTIIVLFPQQALNNFCPQDYLKVVKNRGKLTSDTYLFVSFTKASHTRFVYNSTSALNF